eukprot:COSAG02_NODE_669_length_18681_cov_170.310499_13_plen_109_part_00
MPPKKRSSTRHSAASAAEQPSDGAVANPQPSADPAVADLSTQVQAGGVTGASSSASGAGALTSAERSRLVGQPTQVQVGGATGFSLGGQGEYLLEQTFARRHVGTVHM